MLSSTVVLAVNPDPLITMNSLPTGTGFGETAKLQVAQPVDGAAAPTGPAPWTTETVSGMSNSKSGARRYLREIANVRYYNLPLVLRNAARVYARVHMSLNLAFVGSYGAWSS